MKNWTFYIIAGFFIFLSSCSQNQENNKYTITGSLIGIHDGTVKLIQNNQEDRTNKTLDSVQITNGSFTFNGSVESPEVLTLLIEPGNWSMPVFVENSKISIKADTANSNHYDWTSYGGSKGAELKAATITGSKSQDELLSYENEPAVKAFDPISKKLSEDYNAAANDRDAQEKVREQMDSVRKLITAVQRNWIDSFVKVSPSSAAGAYILNQYYIFNRDESIDYYDGLAQKFTAPANKTTYYNYISDQIAKKKALMPGNTAPDFTLKKPDGSDLTLSSLRGKYVMLDFWASWCVPCRKSIPHWKEVYAKYKSEGFEILSITNDSQKDAWLKALDFEKMPWLQVTDEFPVKNMTARVITTYMAPYMPTYILLDKDGKVILYNASEQDVSDKLKEIFKG